MTRQQVLDLYFLDARHKLIEIAAFIDRVNRADGKPVWSFPTRGKVDSAPVICGGKVIVGSDDGRLYVVSLDTGKEIWSYETGQPVESSPAVAGGRVVVGCNDGNVYCFGEK